MKTTLTLMVAATLILAAGTVLPAEVTGVRHARVITVAETEPFIAEAGDVVNVQLLPTGDLRDRCNRMGGMLNGTLCQDVDF